MVILRYCIALAVFLAGCGPKADPEKGLTVQTTIPPVSHTPRRINRSVRPLRYPLVREVQKLVKADNVFSGFSAMHATNPEIGAHQASFIYLHARNGNGLLEAQLLLNKGLLGEIGNHVRFVAPQFSDPAWFPYVNLPAKDTPISLAREEDLNYALELLRPVVDHEASLLAGDYSRIFLYGFSQGGMMATWAGLMLDRRLGGVVNFAGCLPYFDIRTIPENSQSVPIFHVHDPEDTAVKYNHAISGFESARRAGAWAYEPIFEMVIGGRMRHSLSYEGIIKTSEWLSGII
jgi:predicted esterase